MRKKNKLYTVNHWNRPAFMPEEENLFVTGGGVWTPPTPTLAAPTVAPPINWSNPVQRAAAMEQASYLANNAMKPGALTVQQSNQILSNSLKPTGSDSVVGAAATGSSFMPYLSAGVGLLQGIGTYFQNKKILDTTDYSNYYKEFGNQTYSGDFNSVLNQRKSSYLSKTPSWRQIRGMSSGDKFASAVGSGVSGAMAGAGFGLPGVLVGAGVGTLLSLWGSSEGDKAAKQKENELKMERESALADNTEAYRLGMQNASADANRMAMMNLSAFGGPIDTGMTGMGAIDYGFMSDYLTNKKKKAEQQNTTSNLLAGMPKTMFDFGGDLQAKGSDFPTGLMHIDAGSSHEMNPNDGVQIGVDNEGTPNLVEEGEVIWNDYVFSNRITMDAETKAAFHFPKKKDITYADAAKKLEKESVERPNDPISQAGLQAQMEKLEEHQERQKAEMEAERAKAAFEALSPEEQVSVMQQAAAEEQAIANEQAQEQAIAEQQAMQQQPMVQADGSEAMIGQEPQPMMAEGGKINRFDSGGKAYTKMLNSLGFHTQSEFEKWAEENDIDFGDLWKNNPNTLNNTILSDLWKNEKFKEALKKKNPALFHAFDTKGYDFGAYQPTNADRATIQSISKGNWKATNGQGWFGSEDLAFKQATEGLSDAEIKALTTEQLAERMAKTDAYKNTSKWLENSDNALMYLNTLINDPDTPEVAKKHALQYVKDGKWKDGYTYNYNDVFGKVRATNPGTYWHTAMEANRGNEANNFVINDDGTIEPIMGNVPTDWTSAGNYSWADANNDYTYNYYKRPVVVTTPTASSHAEKKAEEEWDITPNYKDGNLRYAGLLGPALGLGLQAMGVGRPDYSGLEAALNIANGDMAVADTKYIGNYLKPHKFDRDYYANQLKAQAGATRNAIVNQSNGNRGTTIAGLIAADVNAQNALGNLYRQAEEFQLGADEKVEGFNKDTNKFNASAFNQAAQFNAAQRNQRRQANAQLAIEAARERLANDAGWYNGLYGNLNSLFKGIADVGRENEQHNMIAELGADGYFGALSPRTNTGKRGKYWTFSKKSASEGGNIKRKKGKRGLTF